MQKNQGRVGAHRAEDRNPSRFMHRARTVVRYATTGENPPSLSGKQASNSENPESSPMTWATKWGANSTPTTNLPTPSRAVIPQIFHTVANDTAAPLPFDNTLLTSNSQVDSLLLTFQNTRSCLKKSFPVGLGPPGIVYFDSVPPPRTKYAATSELLYKLDDHGDPITVVNRRTIPSSSKWITTGDVKIRFPSADIANIG